MKLKIRVLYFLMMACAINFQAQSLIELKRNFITPPDNARPGVYWYFMDGNMSKQAITGDLESMKRAGIGSVLFLEVNLGVPRGKVDFLSPLWQEYFAFIISECERLGITMTLGIGPGWTGSGGPWVKAEESMRHLVSSSVYVKGGSVQTIKLPKPAPRNPYFGEDVFTPELKKQWNDFYQDQYVLAFPAPDTGSMITLIDRKAIYYRDPYTSMPGTLQYIPESFSADNGKTKTTIDKSKVIDLTSLLQTDGSIRWKVPAGNWTIMRFGMRNNGALTRPAPIPGLGFECDKFDTAALQRHFDQFVGKLLKQPVDKNKEGGFKTLHMDSWEMGAQNWGDNFYTEFKKRRGYDPLPFLPVYSGMTVGSPQQSERFLWDVRVTAQELVIEYHAEYIKKLAHRNGLNLSIEPYDMNPCSDLDLGAVADEPGCEFWNKGKGFASAFSCIEAASIANIMGKPVVMAESFTTNWGLDNYSSYPGLLKDQGDWAFCTGINRYYYHTFAHKAWFGDDVLPGMSMGGYGINWDRGQTWWEMSGEYHKYVARCSYLLRQGRTVADILYLTPEGAPDVFRAPASALIGNPDTVPDKKGFNFDGCSPNMLMKAFVKNGEITFESGASYKILVLPSHKTMTPQLLRKLESLVNDGASIMGNPPLQSPSLSNYPECDEEVKTLAGKIWGSTIIPSTETERNYSKGKIYWGGLYSESEKNSLYPSYTATSSILMKNGTYDDFISDTRIRYIHKRTTSQEIWFVSNKTRQKIQTVCKFRTDKGSAELWNAVSGESMPLQVTRENGLISAAIDFDAYQSFFVVFDNSLTTKVKSTTVSKQFTQTISGPWEVSFDPKWGGPGKIIFNTLEDWTKRTEDGIRYYSGKAFYRCTFKYDQKIDTTVPLYLNLGEVCVIAGVKLNGKDLGILWTDPWQVNISHALKKGSNMLEIEVMNTWANRLIGDEKYPNDGTKNNQWPSWLTEGTTRTSGRKTFTVWKMYEIDTPLQKSGLLGPVCIFKR